MSAPATRVLGIVSTQGEPFTVSGASHTGVFTIVPASRHLAYLTQTEVDAVAKPIYLVLVEANDSTASGSTVTWNGGSWTVKRVLPLRLKGETVAKMLLIV